MTTTQLPLMSGVHRQFALERVIYGQPFENAVREEVERVRARRVFVVTTRRQSETPELEALCVALGNCFVGLYDGVTAHVPRDCVIDGAAAARNANADLLLAFGGGSVIDAVKAMLLCLWRGITNISQLGNHSDRNGVDPSMFRIGEQGRIRMIALPATLSAAEFTWFAGVTDTVRKVKELYGDALMIPQSVILDPRLTLQIPLNLFLASGIKAVDHAAERLASTRSQPFNDAVSTQALRMLAQALPEVRRSPDNLEARLNCQLAAWLSIAGAGSGVGVGASHAIGHVLGAHIGMAHGMTSCVILPAVMRWNLPYNGPRQKMISEAMGLPAQTAADAIENLIESLDLPTRLRTLNVDKAEFRSIAEKTLHDPPIKSNPRPVVNTDDVVEILELAW